MRTREAMLLFVAEQAILGHVDALSRTRYAPTHYSQVNQYMAGRVCVFCLSIAECNPTVHSKMGKLKFDCKHGAFQCPLPSERTIYGERLSRQAKLWDSSDLSEATIP